MQLAISATHETTTAALDYFGQKEKCSAFKHTAEFLRLVRRWFDVVNVKSAYTHTRLNDPIRKPITKEEQEGLNFLDKFGQMMRAWLDSERKTTKMSTDTLKGVMYTCRGLVGLANYLLDRHGDLIQHVLLGKIQSDKIEGRFGHLRKLAGGNYWASVRQFMEGEAVIRAKSLVQLSGYSICRVSSDMERASRQRQLDDDTVIESLLEAASLDGPLQLGEGTEQAIGHLAGYLARSALKKQKCDACHSCLVHNVPSTVTPISLEQTEAGSSSSEAQDSMQSFCQLLNPRLTEPSAERH